MGKLKQALGIATAAVFFFDRIFDRAGTTADLRASR